MTLTLRALTTAALTAILLITAAASAFAHVTIRVDDPAAEGFAKYTLRVPNESDEAATIRLEVQLPSGYDEPRYQPLAGWDFEVSDGVLVIDGGRIEPGEFQEFSFSAQNPAEPGEVEFPAIQIYEDGEEARWVGEADADTPAPRVTIEPAEGEEGGGHGGGDATEAAEPTEAAEETEAAEPSEATGANDAESTDGGAAVPTSSTDGGGTSALTIVALLAGLAGLGLGGAAFARTRRAA